MTLAKRKFIDAPQDQRCKATIYLADKSDAQCGRYAKVDGLCRQHKKIADNPQPIRCNQCEAVMINGVFCHETGCPNTQARYDAESGEWIRQRKCFECGCMVDADDACCQGEGR